MYGDANSPKRDDFYDIHEWNLDKTVKPHVMVRGIMGKDAAGTWQYGLVSASNRRIMVSGTLDATISFNADAANNRVSAVQEDASSLMMSGRSADAALFRVSSIGGTAGDNVMVDGLDQTLSAMLVSSRSVDFSALALSATPQLMVRPGTEDAAEVRVSSFSNDGALMRVSGVQGDAGVFLVSAKQGDAALLRVSSIIDNGSISAMQGDAANLMVSAKSDDGALFRVSSLGPISANQSLSARILEGTAFIGQVSSTLKAGTANIGYVSAVVDNGSVSAKQSDAANLMVSGKSADGALFRVSAVQDGGAALNVSAKSADGALLRTSALPGPMATFFTSAFDIGTGSGVAVVNGAASKVIKVYAIQATLNASGGIKWRSGSTELQGITRLSASAGYVMCVNPPAYVIATTSAGQDLNLVLSATSVSASGWVAGWSE